MFSQSTLLFSLSEALRLIMLVRYFYVDTVASAAQNTSALTAKLFKSISRKDH